MNIAIVNFARTVLPVYGDEMLGFQKMTSAVYRQARMSEGLVGVARPLDQNEHLSFYEREWGPWGDFTLPHYYKGGIDFDTIAQASALSVWRRITDLHNFVYKGVHLRSIRRKDHWFEVMDEPGYALWWTEAPNVTWKDGAKRLEHLLENGPTHYAFTFRALFEPDGNRLTLSACLERGM